MRRRCSQSEPPHAANARSTHMPCELYHCSKPDHFPFQYSSNEQDHIECCSHRDPNAIRLFCRLSTARRAFLSATVSTTMRELCACGRWDTQQPGDISQRGLKGKMTLQRNPQDPRRIQMRAASFRTQEALTVRAAPHISRPWRAPMPCETFGRPHDAVNLPRPFLRMACPSYIYLGPDRTIPCRIHTARLQPQDTQ